MSEGGLEEGKIRRKKQRGRGRKDMRGEGKKIVPIL